MSARHESELRLATEAARAAGQVLRDALKREHQVLSQVGRDIKLQADRDAERVILERLRESDHPVLAEESGTHGDLDKDRPFWMVDPLDGTMNFSRGIPGCAVSIALGLPDAPFLGVVYDFQRDEMFSGVVGEGASLNGTPIQVSTIAQSKAAVLATGFPVNFEYSEEGLHDFAQRIQRFKKVRMIGSAALSLAYVACGRFDAYAEDDIMLWDIAAGLALVNAAGGCSHIVASYKPWAFRVRCAATASIWHP
jgi:myo-inositol-1(or 4)-monophosphatase